MGVFLHPEGPQGQYASAAKEADDDHGLTRPYVFLGPVEYVSHEGEQLLRMRMGLP